jgi:hypothetical protein
LTSRTKAYLQLVRFPNLFTAAADVLAGYLVVCGADIDWGDLLGLLAATTAIYAGGCALNDLSDRDLDARERPFRPIPSGAVSPVAALVVTGVSFGIGLFAAGMVGRGSLLVALVLVILAVSYDTLTKNRDTIGPLNMAMCRSLNLVLGMSAPGSFRGLFAVFPLITLGYVFSLTVLSRFEAGGRLAPRRWHVLGGWGAGIATVLYLIAARQLRADGIAYFSALTLGSGAALGLAFSRSTAAAAIGGAVKVLILCLPVLDAVYASGTHGWIYGIPVALCALPPFFISRYLYVT